MATMLQMTSLHLPFAETVMLSHHLSKLCYPILEHHGACIQSLFKLSHKFSTGRLFPVNGTSTKPHSKRVAMSWIHTSGLGSVMTDLNHFTRLHFLWGLFSVNLFHTSGTTLELHHQAVHRTAYSLYPGCKMGIASVMVASFSHLLSSVISSSYLITRIYHI